jgi:hypothetical protein
MLFAPRRNVDAHNDGVGVEKGSPHLQRPPSGNTDFQHSDRAVAVRCKMSFVDVEVVTPFVNFFPGVACKERPQAHFFLRFSFIQRNKSSESRCGLIWEFSGSAIAIIYFCYFKTPCIMYGDWVENLDTLKEEFRVAKPFRHIVIDSFLDAVMATKIAEEFPKPNNNWVLYDNPIEKKYSLNQVSPDLLMTTKLFDDLLSDEFVRYIRHVTNIDVEIDPYLHGAGLHYHPRGGKLDMHLDYSIHPITGKERRLNLILYLNREWKDSYGGHLQLWNREFTRCEKKILPCFNRAILFETSDISYHGMPAPLQCPEEDGRKSIAMYYVSTPRTQVVHRPKAQFFPLPGQQVGDGMRKLYEIRASRNITTEDVMKYCPEYHS